MLAIETRSISLITENFISCAVKIRQTLGYIFIWSLLFFELNPLVCLRDVRMVNHAEMIAQTALDDVLRNRMLNPDEY